MKRIKIGKRWIGDGEPTYVISEIGSNFDRSLEKAKTLVDLSIQVGADCAKFQSFLPEKIIARRGFDKPTGFQARWKKSVWQIYTEAAFPREWHAPVARYCRKAGIDFSSAPYDVAAVDLLMKLDVPYLKIGSGEVTNVDFLKYVARKRRPIILGVGSATMGEIEDAVDAIRGAGNPDLVLLQCITNYPSHFENANLRAMVTLREAFDCLVGYSDHTPGSVVPLGAVALGGCVIEKHFTDDKTLPGPDHPFAMDVADMTAMIRDIRILEKALGSSRKFITPEETQTVIVQRRSLWSVKAIKKGNTISAAAVEPLRPATGIPPKFKGVVVGRKARVDIPEGVAITWDMI